MIESLAHPDTWVALASLCALEIVLGIDNVVFIAILSARLPKHQQPLAYRLGLGAALISRLLLLFAISWIMGLTEPLFEVLGRPVSGRDIILFTGGMFLIGKATHEIYEKLEAPPDHTGKGGGAHASLAGTIFQIMLLDIVFSLDSVITAVGIADQLWVMVVAMVSAVVVMLVFAQSIGDFVNRHPSMKILALAFLLLIGVLLTAESLGQHVNKGTIYFAMGFSLVVELMNMRMRKVHQPVDIHAGPATVKDVEELTAGSSSN